MPFSLARLHGSKHVTLLETEANGTRQTVALYMQIVWVWAVHSHVLAQAASSQSFGYKWGLQAGGNNICLCLTGVLF